MPAEVRVEFLNGYESERPLTPAEVGWLDILLLWQGLAMVPPADDPTGWGLSALSQLREHRHIRHAGPTHDHPTEARQVQRR